MSTSTLWGYNGFSPGPTFRSRYGEPIVVRIHNNLPPGPEWESPAMDEFGIPQITTHLHNFHTAPESDGGPVFFYDAGHYTDHHYAMAYAGGDPRVVAGAPLVPRPPRGLHGAEHLQGPRRPAPSLRRARLERRDGQGLLPAAERRLRRAVDLRRQEVRLLHPRARVRQVQLRRLPRRSDDRERCGHALLRGGSPEVPAPNAERRAFAHLRLQVRAGGARRHDSREQQGAQVRDRGERREPPEKESHGRHLVHQPLRSVSTSSSASRRDCRPGPGFSS